MNTKMGEPMEPEPAQEHQNERTNGPEPAQEHQNGRTNGPEPAQEHRNGRTNEPEPAQEHQNGRTKGPEPAQERQNGRTNGPEQAQEHQNGRTIASATHQGAGAGFPKLIHRQHPLQHPLFGEKWRRFSMGLFSRTGTHNVLTK